MKHTATARTEPLQSDATLNTFLMSPRSSLKWNHALWHWALQLQAVIRKVFRATLNSSQDSWKEKSVQQENKSYELCFNCKSSLRPGRTLCSSQSVRTAHQPRRVTHRVTSHVAVRLGISEVKSLRAPDIMQSSITAVRLQPKLRRVVPGR